MADVQCPLCYGYGESCKCLNGLGRLSTMAEKDELLIRAMVLLRQINEIYEFPRVQVLLNRYDGMMKRVMDEA